jgi:amidohydrolase
MTEFETCLQRAKALQAQLHTIPEFSGCETETKQTLMDFLRANSDLELVDCGRWFYAAHRENAGEGMALRADMDAVPGADGRARHGCGHDGHSAVMAALAAATSGKTLGKNLFFLFQHAEETGAGAAECCELFEREKIGAIFGFHNCPGFEAGHVLLLPDTFACASKGLLLHFKGSQSHAAYPENGTNPIFPMAAFFARWAELTDAAQYVGLTLATPVGLQAGGRNFGVAAGEGEIDLTLRAWRDDALDKLTEKVTALAGELAAEAGVMLSVEERDVFPATHNSTALAPLAEAAAKKAGLVTEIPPEPFRWSEDFGHYGKHVPAFFCGIGAGKDAAGLHTPDYCWNDAVSEAALKYFSELIGMTI